MEPSYQSQITYLDTPACGLVPPEISNAAIDFYKSLAQNSSKYSANWRDTQIPEIRKNIAGFLQAPENNIAMVPNFSFGINAVVQSLKGTEKILLYERDYPSLVNPFLANHFEVSWLSSKDNFIFGMGDLETELKTGKVDLFAVSHAQWLSGALIDFKKVVQLCHQYSVPVLIDTTQSLGAMPISVKDLDPDVLIASNYKWMNAGFGTGIIYISDTFLKKYPPVFRGANSYELQAGQRIHKISILDLEPGHINMSGFAVLNAAIAVKNNLGLEKIATHNCKLTQQFISECPNLPVSLIGAANMENRCSIIVLKDEKGLGNWLLQNNISVTLRNNTIRLGFHYYNDEMDVQQLIQCIQSLPTEK